VHLARLRTPIFVDPPFTLATFTVTL